MQSSSALTSTIPTARLAPLAGVAQRYFSTVIAWGRNVEGQCGVEDEAVVLQPREVSSSGSIGEADSIASVHAGRQNSSFLSSSGSVWTWGCGRAGKLGHGSSDNVNRPSQVEALVGRAAVKDVALGEQHTLFLDDAGNVWGCGENKEGQCGVGTQGDVISRQQEQSWGKRETQLQRHLLAPIQSQPSVSGRSLSLNPTVAGAPSSMSPMAPPVHPPALPSSSMLHSQTMSISRTNWTLLNGMAVDTAHHLALRGLQPGQYHLPMRLGGGAGISNLFSKWNASEQQLGGELNLNGSGSTLGEDEPVTGITASKYFSALVSGKGNVWTFGACFNGGLGGGKTLSPTPSPVELLLEQEIAAAGGALKVTAGARYCAALLMNGRVLLWGKLTHSSSIASIASMKLSKVPSGTHQQQQQAFTYIEGVPAIADIAAGHQHLLMTDGQAVWSVGRWVDATGAEAGSSSCDAPHEMLRLKGETVAQLVAGPSSSAVVTDTGRVWMWGKLLDRHHAEGLSRQGNQTVEAEDGAWQWAGLGSDAPAVVPGLEGVRAMALGGWHALALRA